MSVSIRKAFKDVFSPKYDKKNMSVLFIFIAVYSALSGFLNYIFKSNPSALDASSFILSFLCLIFGLLVPILSAGYFAVTVNNELYHPKSVFPPCSEWKKLLVTGIISSCGNFILNIIPFAVFFVLFIVFAAGAAVYFLSPASNSNSIIIFLFIGLMSVFLYFIYLFRIVIPLNFIFMHDFEFRSFFKFGEIKEFLNRRKGHYLSFILKSIFISLLLSIVIMPAIFAAAIFSALLSLSSPAFLETAVIFGAFISAAAGTLQMCIIANLAAQYIKSVNKIQN